MVSIFVWHEISKIEDCIYRCVSFVELKPPKKNTECEVWNAKTKHRMWIAPHVFNNIVHEKTINPEDPNINPKRKSCMYNRTSKTIFQTAQQIRWNNSMVRASWGKTGANAFLCISDFRGIRMCETFSGEVPRQFSRETRVEKYYVGTGCTIWRPWMSWIANFKWPYFR